MPIDDPIAGFSLTSLEWGLLYSLVFCCLLHQVPLMVSSDLLSQKKKLQLWLLRTLNMHQCMVLISPNMAWLILLSNIIRWVAGFCVIFFFSNCSRYLIFHCLAFEQNFNYFLVSCYRNQSNRHCIRVFLEVHMVTIISSHWALIAMEGDMVLLLRINLHHSLVYSFHLRQLKYFELFFSSLTLYQPYSEKVSLVICNVFGT